MITDSTPHWRRTRHDHAEAHATLQRVAEAIYEQYEEPIRLQADDPDLSAALELGFLESNDEGVAFSDVDVRRDYLARHIAPQVLEAWDDTDAFADVLEDAQHSDSEGETP